ncbi:MAG: alpha/beta hydrolase [Acidobacteria bacterium]|nr:alpha/beta hydrolase [Acidobacteriota bacterium]
MEIKVLISRYVFKLVVSFLLVLTSFVAVKATTLRVHYDVGFGNSITIRGNKAPFSWSTGVNATWTSSNIWVYSWPNSVGNVEVKPMINDLTWSIGANYKITAGSTVDIYPLFKNTKGTFSKITNFYSPQFGNNRTLLIYLPPSYKENYAKRYPVLYMHDGQNIFDATTSFGGVEWKVDETINSLVTNGSMDEVIVVGIYNTGANRIFEYTPCCDAEYGGGGADSYSSFLINTVKPFVDTNFRTLPSKENTAIMGSSLGGLVSFYIAYNRPDVFSKAGCMSSSFWWDNRALVRNVDISTNRPAVKFYIDAGTNNDGLPNTTSMRDALLVDGYIQGNNLYYYVANGGSHSESSWSQRINIPLTYMFPFGSTVY